MGQKVSPNGLRIGINKDWEAKWYANNKNFSDLLANDVKIRKFLDTKLKDASLARLKLKEIVKKLK